jgi:uncharacterized protein (TIGR02145 family)
MRTIKITIALLTMLNIAAFAQEKGTFTDTRDKKAYKTVKRGTQTWMAEDLKFAKGGGCVNIANCKNGWLYDWATAMALPLKCNKIGSVEDIASCKINTIHKGICPEGYHIPTYDEWSKLIKYAGGEEKFRENLIAKNGWNIRGCTNDGPVNGTDKYGFSALPNSHDGGTYKRWLSTDEGPCDRDDYLPYDHTVYVEIKFLCADGDDIGQKNSSDYSVRCVKDDNSKSADYSSAMQTHFAKGTLGEGNKTRPIEMFFQKISKNGNNLYAVSGKSKTKAAEDTFSGVLNISSYTGNEISCSSSENKIAGGYKLEEKKSITSGYFGGYFTACEKNGKLSKAKFNGGWTKHSNGEYTPCNFGL